MKKNILIVLGVALVLGLGFRFLKPANVAVHMLHPRRYRIRLRKHLQARLRPLLQIQIPSQIQFQKLQLQNLL